LYDKNNAFQEIMKNTFQSAMILFIMLVYLITSTGIVLGFSACPCSGQESYFLNRSDYACSMCSHDHDQHCHSAHDDCGYCHQVDHIYVKNETEHNIALKIKLVDPSSFTLSFISSLFFIAESGNISRDEKRDKVPKIPSQSIILAHVLSRTYPSEIPLS
jgi:hypothetical protein